jgi:hypothetical protein
MKIQLVSYSQPTQEFADQGVADAQELIAYCARVSNPANQLNTETSERLIKYLVQHQHWSPLEMVSVLVWKSQPHVTLQDKSCVIVVLVSKSLVSVMLIPHKN